MTTRLRRRSVLSAGALATPLVFRAGKVDAQLPKGPIRVVLSSGPGSGSDVVARLVAHKIAEATGKQFVIDNRPGAAGVVALQQVVGEPKDGTALLVTSPTTLIIQPLLNRELHATWSAILSALQA